MLTSLLGNRLRLRVDRALRPLRAVWAVYHARDAALRTRVAHYNDFFFDELGVTRESAFGLYQEVARRAGIRTGDSESIHRLAFAALRVSGFKPRRVLELGTHLGTTTTYLAELFPEAMVYTVELPPDDPLYPRLHPEGAARHDAVLAERLARSNIITLRVNTVRLQAQDLPDFDLIWLDAGHNFPEVAWDHFFCLHRLAPGGCLFTDDVRLPNNPRVRWDPGRADVYTVIEYFNARQPDQFRLLLKRESPEKFILDPKYVGFVKRKAPEASS